MSAAVQYLFSGLVNGSVYGLAALAIVLVFRVSGVVNLAQGDAITLGALLTVWLQVVWGLPLPVAALLAVAFTAALSVAFAELAIRPARRRGASGMTIIFVTLALSVVSHEEYRDATDVLAAESGGVRRSEYRNKMNEIRPHRIWAQHVLRRAQVFGVARRGVTFVDFLTGLADTCPPPHTPGPPRSSGSGCTTVPAPPTDNP